MVEFDLENVIKSLKKNKKMVITCKIKHLKKNVPLMSQLKDCDIKGEWLNGRRETRGVWCGFGRMNGYGEFER